MNTLSDLLKNDYIEQIGKNEIEQITQAAVDQIAIPFIVSHDLAQSFHIGCIDPNKKPFSEETKLILYKRLTLAIKPKILPKIEDLVHSVLDQSLESFSDGELLNKINDLNNEKKDLKPKWIFFKSIIQNETFLFEQLQFKTLLKVDLLSFYNELSPMLSKLGDSPELTARVNIDGILNLSKA